MASLFKTSSPIPAAKSVTWPGRFRINKGMASGVTDNKRRAENSAAVKKMRVLIADDHEVVREGTRLILTGEPDIEVCGTAASARSSVEQAKQLEPDVAVIDLQLPDAHGLELARQLRRSVPQTELVVFSGARAERLIEPLFELGVKSFIHKAESSETLVAAVRSAARHKPFLTPQISDILFSRIMKRDPSGRSESGKELTSRERQIVRLLAEGKSNKEIAGALKISLRTVETHRARMMRKLGVTSVAQVVRYALRHGIAEG
jgi:two-component system response regulator NreC